MSIALNVRQAITLLIITLIALFVISIVMLYAVAHIDVLHLIFSMGGGILPNVFYPRG